MRRKMSRAAFVVALLLNVCAGVGAQDVASLSDTEESSGAHQRGVYGLERAASEYGVWGGGSFSSPTLIGSTERVRLGLVAFRYARVLAKGENLALKYTLDAVPVASMSFPSFEASAGGVREVRKTITGAGLSPVGFQLNFRRRERVQPFVQASGGFLSFGERVPDLEGVDRGARNSSARRLALNDAVLLPVDARVLDVVLPEDVQVGGLFVGQPALDPRGHAHHERARRDDCPRREERPGRHQRMVADAAAVHHDGADADQTPALDVAAVQRDVVPDRHLVFKYGRVRAVRDVYDGSVLYVRAVAYPDVEHVAAHDRAEPHRRLLADMNVSDDLRAVFDKRGRVNLRVLASERSNHKLTLTTGARDGKSLLVERKR
jgi:hypothetical protein